MDNRDDGLFCEYCKNGISLEDKKCPNCGADCTKIVNKHKKEKEAKEAEYRDRVLNVTENMFKNFGTIFKIGSIGYVVTFVIVFIVIIAIVVGVFSDINNFKNNSHNDFPFTEKDDEKSVEVKFNELAKTKKFNVILDDYEMFEYKSDNFPEDFNTPEGYQKIAFHFDIENNLDAMLTMMFDSRITLTADDYNVDRCDVEVCLLCYTASGKDKYKALSNSFIPEKSKTEGYVGFLVPVKYKTLKFKVGNSVTITMDNPAYK